MLTRSKRSSTIADKEKRNINLIPIKKEIKTEQEEVTGVSHGFICPQCEAHFLYDEFFVEHIREHHSETTNDMSNRNILLNSLPSSDKLGKENTSPIEKSFKCDDCSYTCTENSDLVKHLRIHLGEKPYKCKECSFTCSKKSIFLRHQRTHTGEKPYKCKECPFACSDKSNHIRHQRTHTGEKPYKCSHCSYSSVRKDKLTLHLRTHTGDKPYKCKEFSFACSDKSSLVQHQRTHTGEKPFLSARNVHLLALINQILLNTKVLTRQRNLSKCKECSFGSARKDNLTLHMMKHTGEKPYKCKECSFACSDKSSLVQHQRTHTGEKPFLSARNVHLLALINQILLNTKVLTRQRNLTSARNVHLVVLGKIISHYI